MIYDPQVNDYVCWENSVEGWVYFKHDDYITIEISVKPKSRENYQACPIHHNDRTLVLCYTSQWKELKYVKSRESKYESDP